MADDCGEGKRLEGGEKWGEDEANEAQVLWSKRKALGWMKKNEEVKKAALTKC